MGLGQSRRHRCVSRIVGHWGSSGCSGGLATDELIGWCAWERCGCWIRLSWSQWGCVVVLGLFFCGRSCSQAHAASHTRHEWRNRGFASFLPGLSGCRILSSSCAAKESLRIERVVIMARGDDVGSAMLEHFFDAGQGR